MLQLRHYEPGDAEAIVTWCQDEFTFRQWCADQFAHFPIAATELNRYYERSNAIPLTAFDKSGIVGHLSIRTPEETLTRFCLVVVDSTKRGQGLGAQMLQLAITYAVEVLHSKKITLGVFENNIPAQRCYRALGWKDVPSIARPRFQCLGESWGCLEMELEWPD